MTETSFADRVASHALRVGVVGLGYVGMPLAMAYARAGFCVTGVDVSPQRVERLRSRESYLMDVPSDIVRAEVDSGRFVPTTDYAALRDVDVIFVCVPTPFDRAKAPDLSYVEDAASSLSGILRPGQLVLLESTTYPGTTEEILIPILEQSGLKAGKDFHVAFSPERIDPGNKQYTIENTSKVVGGIDPKSTERAALVLEQVVQRGAVIRVSNPRVAELTKLLENTFRAVNIALVNELAMLCDRMGIDIWEVIDAAKTKPYGFMSFSPGPGVGGHCIPVDPYYLAWKAREFDFTTKFIDVAAETNLQMPFFTVDKLRRLLGEHGRALLGTKILVLGAAFKKDIDDARNSSAIRVIEILRASGAAVTFHDPHVPRIQISTRLHGDHGRREELTSVPLTDEALSGADCVLILVGHSAVDYGWVVRTAPFVFDAVNVTRSVAAAGDGRVERL